MKIDAIELHQLAHKAYKKGIPYVPRLIDYLIFLLYNSSIHHTTIIGQGTYCAYKGMSVLIHKRSKLGQNVYIGAHVVIGGRSGHREVPVISDDVFIGPNAVILGPIKVGKGSTIGAGSVVIHDVPDFAVVAGVPAKVIRIGNQENINENNFRD